MSIQGKVALVTGGARGMGRAIVLRFAREGAKVAFCDIRPEEGSKVADEVRKAGGECVFIKTDITQRGEVEKMVKTVEEKYGKIDILVNNADWSSSEAFLDSEEEKWERIIAINFLGPLRVTKAVLKGMVARSSGSIVNFASDGGRAGVGRQVVYSACKGGVLAMTKSLAREFMRYNIRVNCVSPGPTDTPLVAEEMAGDPKASQKLASLIPMRRLGRPEEQAAAALFLASDEASYITGQTLSVSGGMIMP